MDIESYIKNLPPELQEKVRTCSSVEELLALAKEAKVPLPDEALAAIAGGDQEVGGCGDPACPKCGSSSLELFGKEKDPNYQQLRVPVQLRKRRCVAIIRFGYESGVNESGDWPPTHQRAESSLNGSIP